MEQSNFYKRKSLRFKGYDYTREGLYFITLCAKNKERLFGEISDGKMVLNEFGRIVYREWENTTKIRSNLLLHQFVIMPNHFHAIVEIENQLISDKAIGLFKSKSQTIGSIIRGYKGITTKKINDFCKIGNMPSFDSIWQRNYYEHIIRNWKEHQNMSEYIINNPIKWDTDSYF